MSVDVDTQNSDFNIAIVEYLNVIVFIILTFRYDRWEDTRKALDNMDRFPLAANPIRVCIFNEKKSMEDPAEDPFIAKANSRTELMMKLSRDPLLNSQVLRPHSSSSCIQLQNLYDPDEEKNLHWEYDIADDVREECSKFGKITHLHVQKNKTGDVYVKFSDSTAAQQAIEVFNGRWFGLRQIVCKYIPENLYNDLFSS